MNSPANTQIGVRKIERIKDPPTSSNGPPSLLMVHKAPAKIGIIIIYAIG